MFPISVAPMMKWTTRHFRYFIRQITRRTLLYTEMVTTAAVRFGDRQQLLGFSPEEKPLALQLGGSDPAALAECAQIAQEMGFDEVNLNAGCPSDRVQNGQFGACLMADPDRVAACVEAMRNATSLPVTVKHRIGIDHQDRYEDLKRFVEIVHGAGCQRFIIHARKAWLEGLSPRENRTVPPLRYSDVYRLKEELPEATIVLNGGVDSLTAAQSHLQKVDGVMIGRAAYENPYLLATVDALFYRDSQPPLSRREILTRMAEYIDLWRERGLYPNQIIRHMHGLFAFRPGTRHWKRYLSENAHKPETTGNILFKAAERIPEQVLQEVPGVEAALPAPD